MMVRYIPILSLICSSTNDMVEYPIHLGIWLVKMLGYYYPILCTIIKALAVNDDTIV